MADMTDLDISIASSRDLSREQLSSTEKRLEGSLVLEPPKGCIQQRYVVAFLAFLGNICCYSLRVNLSVALVAMVNQTAVAGHTVANVSQDECPRPLAANDTQQDEDGEFIWDQTTQGIILGSFFWGYIVTQIPGGWLGQRYSGKWVYGLGIFWTGLLTLLTPVAARAGLAWLLVVRVMEGLGEGMTFPGLQVLIASWSPPLERTRITACAFVGMHLGTFLCMPLTGWICGSDWTGGWPTAFYFFGIMTCVWFVFWAWIIADTPEESRWCSVEERLYIQRSLGNTIAHSKKSEIPPTPWLDIFASVRLWAILVAHFGNNWGFYTLLTSLPQYMNEVLHFNIKENAFVSALPYLAYVLWGLPLSFVADGFRRRGWLSTTAVRKIGNVAAMVLPGAFLLGAGFVGCDRLLAVVCVILSVMFGSFSLCGFMVNHMDIAPRYAGVLMGITNTAGTIPGMLGPYVVGVLTNDKPTRGQWQLVFYITAGIYAFAALFYLAFGTGLKQSWNDHGELTDKLKRRMTTLRGRDRYANLEGDGVQ